MLTLYGLPTCPDCNRALKALGAAGREVSFRDVRAEPLSEAERAMLLAEFGDRIIDRTTNTWRGLTEWVRQSEAEEQLKANPALMARPVICEGATMTLGWDSAAQKLWL